METLQTQQQENTETKSGEERLGQAAHDLRALADEVRRGFRKSRAVMLASIETLLAGADVLSADCIAALVEERDVLQGGMQSDDVKPGWTFEQCEQGVAGVEAELDGYKPEAQRAVLYYCMDRMPEKEAALALEETRDTARDELLNYLLHNRSDSEQTEIYNAVLAAVKEGNGILQIKKAG